MMPEHGFVLAAAAPCSMRACAAELDHRAARRGARPVSFVVVHDPRTWTGVFVSMHRADRAARLGRRWISRSELGEGRRARRAAPRYGSARRHRCRAMPNAASHSRIAFSSIASNTGARSPGEELMTCNTSAVAVCCSSASRCLGDQPRVLHRDHRLRGEVLQQRDLLVGERTHLLAVRGDEAEHDAVLAQRHHEKGAQTGQFRRCRQRSPGPVQIRPL